MPVTNDKFDQLKIDKLKHFLTEMVAKGQSRPYEIFVDNLKVVPKTEDPKDFDNYEYYMNEDTEKIRILIYDTVATPRNHQYCYYVQQNKTEKPSLNGLGDLDGIIAEKLSARDREHEVRLMKDELEETKKKLEEAEDYAEQLEQQLEESKSNKYKLGKLDLVELGGAVLEKLAVRNAGTLEKIGLAGLVAPGNAAELNTTEETSASFQKKTDTAPDLKPEHLQYIPLLQQLDSVFERPQLETVMQIIARFSEEPEHLQTVAELLNIQTPTKQ